MSVGWWDVPFRNLNVDHPIPRAKGVRPTSTTSSYRPPAAPAGRCMWTSDSRSNPTPRPRCDPRCRPPTPWPCAPTRSPTRLVQRPGYAQPAAARTRARLETAPHRLPAVTGRPGTTPFNVSVEQLDGRPKLLTDACAVEACTRAACWCPWTFTHPGGVLPRSGTCVNSHGGSPCAYSDAHTSSKPRTGRHGRDCRTRGPSVQAAPRGAQRSPSSSLGRCPQGRQPDHPDRPGCTQRSGITSSISSTEANGRPKKSSASMSPRCRSVHTPHAVCRRLAARHLPGHRSQTVNGRRKLTIVTSLVRNQQVSGSSPLAGSN